MGVSSVSVTTPAANAANANGYQQADGFFSPSVLGQPTNPRTGGHAVGSALLQSGIRYNVQNTITAHSGGGQGSAFLLIVGINNVTTAAAAADSVILPTFEFSANNLVTVGQASVIVRNSAATNAIAVFPQTGGTINGGSANASVSIAAGAFATFALIAANTWIVIA